jgi:hypothetical protein
MTRNYIRISPDLADEKERDGYSEAAIGAFVKLFCEAEKQSPRGIFKSLPILKAHLGRSARWVSFFLSQNDLCLLPDGRYSVVGWDEWQEGNWQVAERMKRVRESKTKRNAERNGDRHINKDEGKPPVTVATVTPPSRVEAVSGERLAKASDVTVRGDITPPFPPHAPDAVKDPATELGLGMHELLGRQLSAIDLIECQGALNQYAYLTAADLLDRAGEHVTYCTEHNLPTPRTVAGFADTWRRENDHRADQGMPKASRTVNGRTTGMAALSDMLPIPKEAI